MKQYLVSIITPSYNHGDMIKAAIESVINQDYWNLEHIIVDNNSTDDTLAVLGKYSKSHSHIRWISEKDDGISDAMNKGIRLSSGDILFWLGADDILLTGAVSRVVEAFQRHPEVMWVVGEVNFVDEHNHIIKTTAHPPFEFSKFRLDSSYVHAQGTFFKEELINEFGSFDKEFKYAMDYEFWLRIASKYPPLQIPIVIANFRQHSRSKSGANPIRTMLDEYKVRKRFIKPLDLVEHIMAFVSIRNRTSRYIITSSNGQIKPPFPVWYQMYKLLRPIYHQTRKVFSNPRV